MVDEMTNAILTTHEVAKKYGIIVPRVEAFKTFVLSKNRRSKSPKKTSWKRLNRHEQVLAVFQAIINLEGDH